MKIALSFLIAFFLLSTAAAQTGTVTGTVVDRLTQEPLPAANVRLVSTALGASTGLDGKFQIDNVPPGTYEVRVTLVGYQPAVLSDVVVGSARTVDLLAKLNQTEIGLEAVEVRATYFPRTADEPVAPQRLSYEEIRRAPGGFEDVVRAISVLPGVAQVEPGRNDLVVRGGAPSENLYVVDNVEIPNINHYGTQGATGGPLTYINLDFVRETAFSTGGFPVQYGDRMSSVLNIDLREGRSDRVGGKGTISATQFGLNLEGPLSENSTFVLSARRSYLDFIFKANGFNFVPEYWDFFAKYSLRLDQSNSLSFFGIGAIDDVSFFNETADQRYENSRIYGEAQNQYASGLSWRHLFDGGFSTVSLGRSYVKYDGVQNDSLLNPIFTNQSKEGETSLRGDLVLKLSRSGSTELTAGAQVKRVRTETTMLLEPFGTAGGDTISATVEGYPFSGYKGGGYVQIAQRLPFDLHVTLGGRLDYYGFLQRKLYASPRLALRWDASPVTSVMASVGTYHQSPAYLWLATYPENRNLQAAQAYQYTLGLEHLLREDLRLELEGFIKVYDDYPASTIRPYLVMANTGGGYSASDDGFASYAPEPLVNAGEGRAYGVEFLAQKKLSEIPAYGLVSLTLSKTLFAALDGSERPGTYDQRVLLNVSGGYRFDDRWEASLRFRLGTGRPYTPYNDDGTRDVARLYSERLPAWNSLDLRVDRRWNFSRWTLIAYADIQNVYNNKYVGPPRWDAREGKAVFSESAVGILPSIGISAEF